MDEHEEDKSYVIGDLLWAKIGRHPFWPCMVSYDPNEGRYFKIKKVRNDEVRIYHVQYFGKQVQHGWTVPGQTFPFEGEKKFHERKKGSLNRALTISAKKKVNMAYNVMPACKKLWVIAIKEAELALSVDLVERFETFVFRYNTKKPTSNGSDPVKRIFSDEEIKLPSKRPKKDYSNILAILCKLCQEEDADTTCAGDCGQSFHKECLGIINVPKAFKCLNCERGLHSCIVCTKADTSVIKCTKCSNYYHEVCLKKYHCANLENKICPVHTCLSCYNENPRNVSYKGPLVYCFRCPNAFHFKDTCLPVGSVKLSSSLIICPNHFLGKNKISKLPNINVSYCSVCSEGGNLVCCESCPNSYHPKCIDVKVPDDEYYCEDCTKGVYLYNGMIVWAKVGLYRWWPAKIVLNDPFSIVKNANPYDGEFPIRFFGTQEFCWTHRGRVIPYTECHKDFKKTSSRQCALAVQYKKSLEEAAIAYDSYIQQRENDLHLNGKPDAYKHIKVNRAIPPAQITILDAKSILPCSCDPGMPYPCGIDSMCLNRSMLMECHSDVCRAKDQCQNQKFQKRQYATVKIIKTKKCGWGLKSCELIIKGSFVIEYVGEIITHEEYRRRVVKMREDNIQNYYFLYLDSRRMIDAGPRGNLSRFINHSCRPNCEMVKWSVNGDARIGIFALTDIQPGEELTFNYQSDSIQFDQKCHCDALNCKGFIGRNGQKNGKKK